MKIIGGHFELELKNGKEYHQGALALNSGRNSLLYVLKTKQIQTLYVPRYICNSVINTIESENVSINFYDLENDFSPKLQHFDLKSNEFLLYVNYFGLGENNIDSLIAKTPNIIIDNTQAFFSPPRQAIDTIYSSRKFFGVPDGGYLYTNALHNLSLKEEESTSRLSHLLVRIEKGYDRSKQLYERHENTIDRLKLKKMSILTSRILKNVDYNAVLKRRLRNMKIYQNHLGSFNDLYVPSTIAPIVYPLYLKDRGDSIRQKLKKKGIIVTRYWASAFERLNHDSFEDRLATDLIGLPIDQRYSDKDISYVSKTIKSLI
jgi:hypothetical protein